MTAPRGAVQPGEAMVRGACPVCKQPATWWLWVEDVKQPHAGHPRRAAVSGVITDLIHDTADDTDRCGGLA